MSWLIEALSPPIAAGAVRPRRLKLVVAIGVLGTLAVAGALWTIDLTGDESRPVAPTPSVTAPAPLTSQEREALTVSDISVSGTTVTFMSKWRTRSLGTWCSSDVITMTIRDGKILTLEEPNLGGVPCD